MADQLAPLQQFEYLPGMNLRVLQRDGEPWFVATDVCKALAIQNPTDALATLDQEERSRFNLGHQGSANIISESGLYLLVLKSRKEEAKAFQKWVTGEVRGGHYRYRGTGHPVGKDHSVIPRRWSHLKAPYWSPLGWSGGGNSRALQVD